MVFIEMLLLTFLSPLLQYNVYMASGVDILLCALVIFSIFMVNKVQFISSDCIGLMILLWLYQQMKLIHTHRFGIIERILAYYIVSKE